MNSLTVLLAFLVMFAALCGYLIKTDSDTKIACVKANKCWRGNDSSCLECRDIK